MEFYKETEFRETETGRIPTDWELKTAEEICSKVTDGTHDTPKPAESGFYLVTSKNIKKRGLDLSGSYLISEKDFNEVNKRSKVDLWDVLFSMIGTVGATVIIDEICPEIAIKNVGLFKTNNNEIIARWLHYYFNSDYANDYINANKKVTTQQYLPLYSLRSFPIVLPKDEKEIGAIVLLLKEVDYLIQQTDSIIRKTQELKKGLMQELLTRGIGHKEFKYSEELGCEIPIEWEVRRLEDVCDILDNQRIPLNGKARRGMQGDIPYYGANGVLDFINDFIFDDKLILIAEDGGYFDEYATRSIAYMVEGKCWVNNHAHVLKVKENEGFVTEFVLYSLEHKNIIPYIKGSTRSKLNQNELRILPVGMPKLKKEQEEIASIFSNVDNKIEKEKRTKQYLEKIKKGLMQILLTGQVRIKVN